MRRTRIRFGIFASIALALSNLTYLACDDSTAVKEAPTDAARPDTSSGGLDSSIDSGAEGGSKDCFDNPKTHFEIINACTNATKIPKTPMLPRLLSDGGLPPLL